MMKEFFKKNWKLVSIISAAVVAVIVTVVLCVCLIPSGKSKLATPEKLSVSTENVLTWDKVENADNGYTVKIGEDESTKVSANSLDLTTVTAKLKEGENKLSVKANATDAYEASDYSAEVTYNYNPVKVTPFDKLAAPTIDVRTVNWTAVDGATNGYTVKVGDKTYTADTNSFDLNTIKADLVNGRSYEVSVKVNAAGDHSDSVYSDIATYKHDLLPAEAAADFKASVEAIGTVTAASKDKIEIAKANFEALTPEAKEVEGVSGAIATLKEKDCAYFALLVAAIPNVEKTSEVETFTQAEAAIEAAKLYYDTLIDNQGAAADNTVLVNASSALTDLVTEIKGEVDTVVANIIGEDGIIKNLEVTEDYATVDADQLKETLEADYAALNAAKTAIDAEIAKITGAYATKYWDEEKKSAVDAVVKTAIDDKITEIEAVVVEVSVSESVSTSGDIRRLYLTVQFKNVNNKLIDPEDLPLVTVKAKDTDDNDDTTTVTVKQQLTKTESGEYVAIISLKPFTALKSAAYSIGSEEKYPNYQDQPIDLSGVLHVDNPYFTTIDGNDGFKVAFDSNGIIFTIQATETEGGTAVKTYLEIYAKGAISTVTDEDGTFLEFNGAPIVGENGIKRIDVSDWTEDDKKFEKLNRYLALNFGDYFIGETRSVYFVIYGEGEEDGETVRTLIKADTVSSAQEFKLTENDKYYTIPDTGKSDSIKEKDNDYDFYLMVFAEMRGMIDDLNALLVSEGKSYSFSGATDDAKNDALKAQFGIRITIKSAGEVVGTAYLPLAENQHKLSDIKFRWARAYFEENSTAESVTFENLTYSASYYTLATAHDDVKDLFRQGKEWDLTLKEGSAANLQTVTLTKADRLIALLTTGKAASGSDDGISFATPAVMGMQLDGSGEANGYSINQLLEDNGKDYNIASWNDLGNDFGIRATLSGKINGEPWEYVLYLDLGKTYKLADFAEICSRAYYKEHPTASNGVTVSELTLKACYYVLEDANADIKDLFKESAEWEITGISNSMVFDKSTVTLPNTLVFINNGGNPNLFPNTYKYSDIVINGYATLVLRIAKSSEGANAVTFYIVYDKKDDGSEGQFVILANANDALSTGMVFSKGGAEYWTPGFEWFKGKLGSDFNIAGEGWYFQTEFIDNTEEGTYVSSSGPSVWTTFFKPTEPVVPEPGELAVPTGNQIGLTEDGNGIITFMIPGTDGNEGDGHRGWVLYHGANYIVVKFHVNAQDTAGHIAYLIPDMVHPTAGLKMYASIDKSGPALNCGTVENGWVHIYDEGDGIAFTKWIVEAYGDINEGDFKIEEAQFYTSIYSDGNGNYVAGDGTNFSAVVTWADRVKVEA